MNKMVTVDEYSRDAVESFIQTVVLVDDELYSQKGTLIEGKVAGPKRRKPATKNAETKARQKSYESINEEEKPPLLFHDVQAKFAKKNIVCSPHQPGGRDSVGKESIAYKLCSAADIVIVDWSLGDAGERATLLIENLILQSLKEDPHQLRLILIYTAEPNLFDVADKVSRKLAEEIPDEIEDRDADGGLAFHTPNARVVVFGKPGHRLEEEKKFEVSESELADCAIKEFCKLTDGLIQGGILKGLAAIREQSRRVLAKFPATLDGAFLTHRALNLPDEEAFDHIIPLLVAEIEAVLEDSLPHPLVDNSTVEDWCDNHWEPETHATATAAEANINTSDLAKTFCANGLDFENDSLSKKKRKSLLPEYLSKSTNRELSVLMSQRTHYGDARSLAQGTIIREMNGEKRYLLCLQPACDSVRLKSQTTFVFCSMIMAEEQEATHVVHKEGDFEDLHYKPKIKNCVTLVFKPNKNGYIAASEREFTDVSGNTYQWIAQLKPKHAHRAVEQFARELSRVGLTESEWLRLKSK